MHTCKVLKQVQDDLVFGSEFRYADVKKHPTSRFFYLVYRLQNGYLFVGPFVPPGDVLFG
jgi:hypothetical protein